MDNLYWSVLKANGTIAICSILITFIVGLAVRSWHKRRMKRMAAKQPSENASRGPQMWILGAEVPKPAHCPLCGRDWPLPGPELPPQKPKDAPL